MSIIGTFEKLGDEYRGAIILLDTETRLRIEPIEKTQKLPPDFHLIAKEKVGAAWKKMSQKGTEYLSVALDDLPGVRLMLFQAEDGSYELVTPRKQKKQ